MDVLKQSALFVRANLWIVPLIAVLVWMFFCFLDPAPRRDKGSGTYAVVRSLFQTQDTPAQFEELDGGNWQMLSTACIVSRTS
jgi:hypothetical protein